MLGGTALSLCLNFQALQAAFARCVSVLSASSTPEDMAVEVHSGGELNILHYITPSLLVLLSLPPLLPFSLLLLIPSPLFSSLPPSLSPSLSPSQVCTHISRCYRVSAQFEACREAITEVPNIVKDTCRVLYYKVCDIQWLHHNDIMACSVTSWLVV